MNDDTTLNDLWFRAMSINGSYPDKEDSVSQILEDLLYVLAFQVELKKPVNDN